VERLYRAHKTRGGEMYQDGGQHGIFTHSNQRRRHKTDAMTVDSNQPTDRTAQGPAYGRAEGPTRPAGTRTEHGAAPARGRGGSDQKLKFSVVIT
jgi:hypothetical protein